MPVSVCYIVGGILALLATIAAYIFIMPKSKDGKLNKFFQFIHDLFSFKKLYIEAVLKFLYVLTTLGCVTVGFLMLFGRNSFFGIASSSTFGAGLAMMLGGPIVTRLLYELMMLTIILVSNVIEINTRQGGKASSISFASADEATEKLAKAASSVVAPQPQQPAAPAPVAPAPVPPYSAPVASAPVVPTQEPSTAPVAPAPVEPTPAAPTSEPAAPKFCGTCGYPIKGGKFCPKCGSEIK